LVGCQRAIDVDVLNRCGQAVEAQGGSTADSRGGWVTVGQGKSTGLVSLVEDATDLYVDIRTGRGEKITTFVVPISSLPKPAKGDADVEVTLEREHCPPAA
jgi:hypothetical protein